MRWNGSRIVFYRQQAPELWISQAICLGPYLPGPNSHYALTIAVQKGWRYGAWGALGIFIGDSVLMLAVVLGAASILTLSPSFLVLCAFWGLSTWPGWVTAYC
uniref:Lysine exporter protein (LYSE/YGGA) n=1 Tax=Polynucleobacter necessarius subsp. necessarius (strain STIR1) TaxID=452638 RepID=B1XVG4_POLNS